jgi:hypothetical protein
LKKGIERGYIDVVASAVTELVNGGGEEVDAFVISAENGALPGDS